MEMVDSGKRPVLIVEDDIDLRDCVREELEQAGYRVVTAGNGHEGLEQLETNPEPCLIVLDLMMPVMNGYEFLAALRDRDQHIPVVVTSAFLDSVATPEGVSGLLPKPFRMEALLAVLARYC